MKAMRAFAYGICAFGLASAAWAGDADSSMDSSRATDADYYAYYVPSEVYLVPAEPDSMSSWDSDDSYYIIVPSEQPSYGE